MLKPRTTNKTNWEKKRTIILLYNTVAPLSAHGHLFPYFNIISLDSGSVYTPQYIKRLCIHLKPLKKISVPHSLVGYTQHKINPVKNQFLSIRANIPNNEISRWDGWRFDA